MMHNIAFMLLCLSGGIAIFSSTISKSPVLPLFASHLGATTVGVGAIAAISAFTGIILSIPAGLLSDKFGRKRLLLISGAVFATAPFSYLTAGDIITLGAIRLYHGVATALFLPVAMAYVSDMFQEGRGERMGWFSTSTLLGRFIAPITGGSILGAYALRPENGFHMVYLVCGGAGVAALILIFLLPAEPKTGHEKKSVSTMFGGLRDVLTDRRIVITCAVEASVLFAYGAFETFLPLHAIARGQSAAMVGVFLSSQIITLALTKPFMGKFSDRHGRVPQIIAGVLTGAVSIGLIAMASGFLSFILLSILFGLSLSVITSATSALIADLSREGARGAAMGALGSIMDIGHTTGPLVAGAVAGSFGYAGAFTVPSALLIVIGAAFFVIFHHPARK